jgi:hypothetical protein
MQSVTAIDARRNVWSSQIRHPATTILSNRPGRSTAGLLNPDFPEAVQDGLEQLFVLLKSESEFPVIRVPNLFQQPAMALLKNA